MWRQDCCPICGSSGDRCDVATVRGIPARVGIVSRDRDEAVALPKGDLQLALCRRCGYVGNAAFDPSLLYFGPGYEASLHQSPTYRRFLDALADGLARRFGGPNKQVLEIGCGSGYFLERLVSAGFQAGIGIDPAAPRGRPRAGADVTYIPEPYDDRQRHIRADLVCCRHTLHAMVDPLAVVTQARGAVADTRGAVYLEVPNANDIFAQGAVWRLMYEYASYFTNHSLANLLRACECSVIEAGPCFEGGQYVSAIGEPAEQPAAKIDPPPAAFLASAEAFGRGLSATVQSWEVVVRGLLDEGRRVAIWGAGGRGLNFLTLVPSCREVKHIVDIGPQRQGGFVPESGQLIEAPESLIRQPPDTVIVTNATYLDEVRTQLADLGLEPELLTL